MVREVFTDVKELEFHLQRSKIYVGQKKEKAIPSKEYRKQNLGKWSEESMSGRKREMERRRLNQEKQRGYSRI